MNVTNQAIDIAHKFRDKDDEINALRLDCLHKDEVRTNISLEIAEVKEKLSRYETAFPAVIKRDGKLAWPSAKAKRR